MKVYEEIRRKKEERERWKLWGLNIKEKKGKKEILKYINNFLNVSVNQRSRLILLKEVSV